MDNREEIISNFISFRCNDINMHEFWNFFLKFFHIYSSELHIKSDLNIEEYKNELKKSDHLLSELLEEDFFEYVFHDKFYDEDDGSISGSIPEVLEVMIQDKSCEKLYIDCFKIGYTKEQSNMLKSMLEKCDGLKYVNMVKLEKYKPYIIKYNRIYQEDENIEIVDMILDCEFEGYASFYPVCLFD